MLRASSVCLRRPVPTGQKHVWGAPGKPLLTMKAPSGLGAGPRQYLNILATAEHHRSRKVRFYAYLGKHVPRPQKALWSPDTPVPQDQYSYKLTTIDIDTFKYWFGIKEARVDRNLHKVLTKAGLLPPGHHEKNPLMPQPIFKKEELYAYWLKNRPPLEQAERAKYSQLVSSTEKYRPETVADAPSAPWL
jgi:hypothetical protein